MKRRNFKYVLFLLPIFFLLSGCDQEEECDVTGNLYVSTDLNATEFENLGADICPGKSVLLKWKTSNADSISIEADNVADIGTVEQEQGTTVVSPSTSTIYKLVTTSDDCQPMQAIPQVTVRVYDSPMQYSLRASPANSSVPDWITRIQPIQVSEGLLVTSIDNINMVTIEGDDVEACDWDRWRVDKDGSVQASSPLPALTNPPFNPAGQYTITAVEATSSSDYNDICIRHYAILSMTLACPSGN